MANIKISELNELTEKENDDYLAIVDTSASETKKISVEKLTASGVQLIAVTDTAPEEYETGDKYYNTTDNKIYTATSNNWANPQTPIENIFYIILETQNIYTYDDENETLVSVGGGAGGGDSTPIGTVEAYAGANAPNGYLLCDGSAVSRTTYKDLFRVIGTTYGSGDGSTTFNLPDIKGKVVVMLDSNDTDFDTLGETGGSKTDSLSNAYTKMVDDGNGKLFFNVSGGKNWTSTNYLSVNGSTSASQNSTYGINLGGSVSKVQPYIVLNYIIKVQKLAGEVLSEQLPVGTIVDYDGQASDIPTGWETYGTGQIKKTSETRPLASHTVNTYSESESNAYSCDYSNKAFGGVVLWTNDSPNGAFASQFVSLDLSKYDGTAIIYIIETGASWGRMIKNTGIMPIQSTRPICMEGTIVENTSSSTFAFRSATVSSTGISFGTGYNNVTNSGATTRDYACVPWYIIGYKTGLFPTQQSTRSVNTYSGDIETNDDIVIDDSQEETPIDEGNDENNK